MTHWNLARCLRKLDRPAEAAAQRRRCWELECAEDGPAEPGTLQSAVAVVRDLLAAQQPDAAQQVINTALQTVEDAEENDPAREKWVLKLTDLAASIIG